MHTNFRFSVPSAIVADADVAAGLGEGCPGDVEPAGACQELVGAGVGLQQLHEALELRRVARADVGCLPREVLRGCDTSDLSVHRRVPEA